MRSFTTSDTSWGEVLKGAGWSEVSQFNYYVKGNWQITFDTSTWMHVGTTRNERVFDVPVPEAALERWTINLIDHLLTTDDRIHP